MAPEWERYELALDLAELETEPEILHCQTCEEEYPSDFFCGSCLQAELEDARLLAQAAEADELARETEWDEITRRFLDLDSAGHKDHWFWEV